ncbi:Chemotaxis protein methyltransferase CheR [Acidisarcina polymorpha]|uniref:histidine kinase n=1 Tax=Acidisarcina polymorpha TaxID=2211140 RepID=A0A2Z5FVR4_9BACT|nr:PAS domain-containing protein [Acidisarcina polymorpha]AXC10983.1 Chemotaxis protein methyltransferase CheR [Acidisarcina polymorpha]
MAASGVISKLRVEHALASMSDAFVLLDSEFRIAYMNPAAERTAGVSAGELLGATHWEAWPASRGTEVERRYRQAMLTGEAQHFQHHYVSETHDLWLEIHAHPGGGGLAIYFRDLSERKLEQEGAARIERAYKAALSNTPDLVYVFDLNHRFVYANEALLTMWGRTWNDAIGKTCLELGYPEWHAAMHDREIDQVVATRRSVRGEVPFAGTHGRRIYDYIFVPVIGPGGEVESVAGTTRDVTERQQSEQVLRASEERLRLAQNAGQLATWDWDIATGEVVWTNDSDWIYGRAPAEMTPIDRCAAAVHEEDRDATTQALQRTLEDGVEYNHEFRVIWPDQSVHWLVGRGKAIYDADGRPARVLGVNWDITARKQAEDILRNERSRLAELLQQAPALMALLRGPDHIFEVTNPLYQELIGGRTVIGKPIRSALPETAQQDLIDALDQVYRTGEPFTAHGHSIDFARHSGQPLERRYLNLTYQPMRDADGNVSGVILLGVDVTEARKAEEALRQSEKLAAVGRLAASISHEINNPLEAVTNLLYLMQTDQALSPETRSYLETAQSEITRITHITTQTLRFYRQSTRAARIKVRGILDSVAVLYERRLRHADVTLTVHSRTLRPVMIYAGELRQIVANLVGNALDAVGSNGRIEMRERPATDWKSGRKGVLVTVADSGHGIGPEIMPRLFDPFFSTKGQTGTGLGLWVSKEIVEKNGGRIRVRSRQQEPHRGTVFSVFLPDLDVQEPISSSREYLAPVSKAPVNFGIQP